MAELVTFLVSFAGGALGGALGVWLAWQRLQRDYARSLRSQPGSTGL